MESLRQAYELIDLPVLAISAQLRLLFWNPTAAEALTLPAHLAPGAFLTDAFQMDSPGDIWSLVRRALRVGQQRSHAVLRTQDERRLRCVLVLRRFEHEAQLPSLLVQVHIQEDLTLETASTPSPEQELGFGELVDLREVQAIQDAFSRATGVASVLVAPDGRPLTQPSNFSVFCRDVVRRTQAGLEACMRSDAEMGAAATERPHVQRCLACGLWDGAASIHVGGRHLASWLVGQVRSPGEPVDGFVARAVAYGANPAEAQAAARSINEMEPERFAEVCRSLHRFAALLSNLALQNTRTSRYLAKLEQAEQETKASEARYRLLVEQAPIGVLTMDREGRALEVNRALLLILGSPSVDATKSINLLEFPPLVQSGITADFQKCMTTGRPLLAERPYTSRWEKDAFLRYHLSPLRDADGHVEGCLAMVEDFSAVRHAEREKTQLEEQLHQAQKMEAVGKLAGGIAHDFNNLLTGINGQASLALLDLPVGNPYEEAFTEIVKAAERAAALIRQLLAFSRKQVIELAPVNLNDLIENLRKMLRRLIGDDIELVFDPQSDIGPVKADAGQLEQVILNLVVNARDAMPRGGKLTLTTREVMVDMSPYLSVQVADTGVGMDEAVRLRVFEPFFTTKPKDRGTGLGLATTYGIVRQHGGQITVASTPGEGSVFTVLLPRCDATLVGLPRQPSRAELPVGSGLILLVDDDDTVRITTEKMLTRLGYQVVSCGRPEAALAQALTQPFDLLMTDVVMPVINGRELAEQLKAKRPQIKILFASGYAEAVIAHHGVVEQGVNFIPKPYDLETLARKVFEVLTAR